MDLQKNDEKMKRVVDLQEKYEKMKSEIIKALGKNYDLKELKNYFKNDIDSPRTLNQIKSLSDLIEILEERDVLNYQCPTPLFYIGQLFKNEGVKDFVNTYRNYYLTEEEDTKCICGLHLNYHPSPPIAKPTLLSNGNNYILNVQKSSNDDLMEAIKNVADRIPDWRVLSSELHILECQIDRIYEKHPKDHKKQAYEALLIWMKNDKENATVDTLDKALNARLCRQKGIGSYLRMSLPGLDD